MKNITVIEKCLSIHNGEWIYQLITRAKAVSAKDEPEWKDQWKAFVWLGTEGMNPLNWKTNGMQRLIEEKCYFRNLMKLAENYIETYGTDYPTASTKFMYIPKKLKKQIF